MKKGNKCDLKERHVCRIVWGNELRSIRSHNSLGLTFVVFYLWLKPSATSSGVNFSVCENVFKFLINGTKFCQKLFRHNFESISCPFVSWMQEYARINFPSAVKVLKQSFFYFHQLVLRGLFIPSESELKSADPCQCASTCALEWRHNNWKQSKKLLLKLHFKARQNAHL